METNAADAKKNHEEVLKIEHSRSEKLVSDLKIAEQNLEKAETDIKKLETNAADAEKNHAELQRSEKSRAEKLESDLKIAEQNLEKAETDFKQKLETNAADAKKNHEEVLISERSRAEKLESDLKEAVGKAEAVLQEERTAYAAKLQELDKCLHAQQCHIGIINDRNDILLEKSLTTNNIATKQAELNSALEELKKEQLEFDAFKVLMLTYPEMDVNQLLCVVNQKNTALLVIFPFYCYYY